MLRTASSHYKYNVSEKNLTGRAFIMLMVFDAFEIFYLHDFVARSLMNKREI
jgi:hypothetical protein